MTRKMEIWVFRRLRWFVLACVWFFIYSGSYSQVIYGNNRYIEYHPGSLPIVISAPHGGSLTPAGIPDRACSNIENSTDLNVAQLALQIDSSFYKQTGCHIHLIICNLKRTKIDCNREINEATCGNTMAQQAWKEYHQFIDSALQFSLDRFTTGFFIDLHGHGHAKQRIELGYGLSSTVLRMADGNLNTTDKIRLSSIQNLVGTNVNWLQHADLLRGDHALGTLLGEAGYPAVPSKQIPSPDTGDEYYSGGYNTYEHTSIKQGLAINGVQIECYRIGIRDTYATRKAFADSLASVLIKYLRYHQNLNLNSCSSGTDPKTSQGSAPLLFPNVCQPGQQVYLSGESFTGEEYQILNAAGQLLQSGKIEANNSVRIGNGPDRGILVMIISKDKRQYPFRFIVL